MRAQWQYEWQCEWQYSDSTSGSTSGSTVTAHMPVCYPCAQPVLSPQGGHKPPSDQCSLTRPICMQSDGQRVRLCVEDPLVKR